MQFKALIQGLCERLGLRYADDTLTDNEFVLQADNTQVRLQARGPLLQLITQLGAIPTSDSEKKKLYERLLARSGAGALRFGAAVALDQDTNHILLYQRFQMHALSILELEQALENFLMGVDHYNTAI